MPKQSNDPMHALISNGRIEDAPDDGMKNYADAPDDSGGAGVGDKIVDGASRLGTAIKDGIKSLAPAVAGPASAVVGAASKVTGAVGSALNIGHGASMAVTGALAIALGTVGVVGVASAVSGNDLSTLYVGSVDCKKVVDEAKTTYGYGEREIPEEVGGIPCGYVATWEGTWGALSGLGLVPPLSTVRDFCQANGGYQDDKGFERFGDYYLIACSVVPFGVTEEDDVQTGDWITFYLSDGTPIECVVCDTKGDSSGPGYNFRGDTPLDQVVPIMTPTGPAEICGWGHVDEARTYVNVLEFVGFASENNQFELITGKKGLRVESFTTHGTAPEFESVFGHEGAVGMASSNKDKARSSGLNSSADECRRFCPQTYDNSGIANAALSLAYTCKVPSTTHQGTELLNTVSEMCEVIPVGAWAGTQCNWDSCDRGVCVCVRWGGADDNYPSGACSDQITYLTTQGIPDGKWMEVPASEYTPGSKDFTGLQPGDIFVAPNHTSVYIGEELVKEHEFDAEQNVGPLPDGAFSASASLGGRVLCITTDDGTDTGGNPGIAYRCIQPETNSKYADGSSGLGGSTVAATMGCGNKYKQEKKSYSDDNYSDTLCIGDDVMAACVTDMKSTMKDINVDTVNGRQFTTGASSIMDVVNSEAQKYDRIVIATGNNEQNGLSTSHLKNIVTSLRDKDIWLVTEYSGRNAVGTKATNMSIRELASQYSNVHVIDWFSLADKYSDDWFADDKVNITSDDAKKAYANLIRGSIGGGGTGGAASASASSASRS